MLEFRRQKMLLGIPFYAYGWSGVADVNHGPVSVRDNRFQGDHFYSYDPVDRASIQALSRSSEIADALALFDGKIFWTFDDPLSIRAPRSSTHTSHKLGGVMAWELSNDSGGRRYC